MLAPVQDFCPGPGSGQDLTGTWPRLDLDLTWDLEWDLEWDLDLSLTIIKMRYFISNCLVHLKMLSLLAIAILFDLITPKECCVIRVTSLSGNIL